MRAAQAELGGRAAGGDRLEVHRLERRQRLEAGGGLADPAPALVLARGLGHAEQVGGLLVVVERDQPVGEHEGRVGQRGLEGVVALAVGLQLVAEVAHEAAVEVERQVVGLVAQPLQLAAEVVEDRLLVLLAREAAGDLHLAGGHVRGHDRAERAAAGAHEREARALVDHRAVEPEGVAVVAVEVHEDLLGVVEAVDALDLQAQARALRRRPLLAVAVAGRLRERRALAAGHAGGQVAEVGEQAAAPVGADRLGVELDAPDRPLAVGGSHDHAVGGPGDRLEVLGQRLRDAERVVADHREALGDLGEERRVVVVDGAHPAVHHLGRVHHRRAGAVADPLVAEADAQQRHLGLADRVGADAEVLGIVGPAGAGRDHDVVEVAPRQLAPGGAVVAHDGRLLAVRLRDQLEEVVRERVVVVDQQRLHCVWLPAVDDQVTGRRSAPARIPE